MIPLGRWLPDSKKSVAQVVFFLVLFAVGLGVYRDYGMSIDETSQRSTGGVNLKYIVETLAPSLLPESAGRLPALKDFADRDYGPAFEVLAGVFEVALKLNDPRDVYMFRHLLTFLMAFAGIVAVHRMACRRFKDWRIGLLGALLLVLTPRLFAESFYNSKDIVFMAVFAIGMNTMISFVLRPGIGTALLHAAATAFAIDVRIMAILLPAATVSIVILRLLKRELAAREALRGSVVYLAAACIFVPAMWMWLWADPLGNFIDAFRNMAKFRWAGEVLYLGRSIPGGEPLPWHYIPVWMAITTPPLYLALFIAGMAATLRRMASCGLQLWRTEEELQDLFFLGVVVVPIAAVIVLHSVVYDGWRHLYFVCPAFLLIAVNGWMALWNASSVKRAGRLALAGVTALSVVHVASWMWRAHPFENVYFNVLAGKDLRTRFELDYWGLANRQGLEHILANDRRDVVSVRADSMTPLLSAFYMIKAGDRKRLLYAEPPPPPDYIFSNYRWVKDSSDTKYANDYDLYYQVRVDDEAILSVFRRKDL